MEIKRTPCQIFSRVVGWITPTSNWNKGKAAEYPDRKTYKLPKQKDNLL